MKGAKAPSKDLEELFIKHSGFYTIVDTKGKHKDVLLNYPKFLDAVNEFKKLRKRKSAK